MPEIWEVQDDDSDLVQQLRKQIKTLNTSKTEAEARAAAAEGKLTTITLTDTLADKVANPTRAAQWLVKDGIDTADAAAVSAYLEENKDLFPPKDTSEAPPQGGEQEPIDDAVVEGYQQLSGMSAMQRPADMNKLNEVNRTLPDDATPQQVAAAYRKAGL